MGKKLKIYLSIFLLVGIFFSISIFYSSLVVHSTNFSNGKTIVLDAGHGGRDGGSIGKNGTIEKEINLKYALLLKNKLELIGYKIILTRNNDDGLYSAFSTNKKQSDMQARFKIIQRANPNLVISIHMNSFPNSSVRGATTYYRKDDDASELCANLIQQSLHTYCNAKNTNAKVGDYFMLNCSYYTSVLIECGFLSNPEEEILLNSPTYQEQLISSISKGIMLYFG